MAKVRGHQRSPVASILGDSHAFSFYGTMNGIRLPDECALPPVIRHKRAHTTPRSQTRRLRNNHETAPRLIFSVLLSRRSYVPSGLLDACEGDIGRVGDKIFGSDAQHVANRPLTYPLFVPLPAYLCLAPSNLLFCCRSGRHHPHRHAPRRRFWVHGLRFRGRHRQHHGRS